MNERNNFLDISRTLSFHIFINNKISADHSVIFVFRRDFRQRRSTSYSSPTFFPFDRSYIFNEKRRTVQRLPADDLLIARSAKIRGQSLDHLVLAARYSILEHDIEVTTGTRLGRYAEHGQIVFTEFIFTYTVASVNNS